MKIYGPIPTSQKCIFKLKLLHKIYTSMGFRVFFVCFLNKAATMSWNIWCYNLQKRKVFFPVRLMGEIFLVYGKCSLTPVKLE